MNRAWIGTVGTLLVVGACDGGDPPVITPTPSGTPLENPPSISGGTLAITRDGSLLVASDADYDQIHVIGAADAVEMQTLELEPGDEPGRVIEGDDRVVYVALRRAGEIVRLDLDGGELSRGYACPAPRGMAYDPAQREIHVACAGGELVTLSADLEPVRTLQIERDLRDVVMLGDQLVVSKFRSAEVLVIEDGVVLRRMRPFDFVSFQE